MNFRGNENKTKNFEKVFDGLRGNDKRGETEHMNNTIAQQKRAAKGGEYGANGEWYEGGKFINTVEENGKQKKKWKKPTGRRQVAPYVWEMQPESDMMPLYGMLAGFEKLNHQTGKFEFNENLRGEYATADFIKTRMERIARYNAGEKWL